MTRARWRWCRLSGMPPATYPQARQAPSRRTLLLTSHPVGTATSSTSLARSPLTTGRSSPIPTTRTARLKVCASTRPSRSPEGREPSPARPGAAASSVQYLRIVRTTRSFMSGRSLSRRAADARLSSSTRPSGAGGVLFALRLAQRHCYSSRGKPPPAAHIGRTCSAPTGHV
jgi:hypothetical protein